MRVKLTEPDFDRLIEILQALPDFGLADKRVDFVGDVFYASKRQQDILGHLDLAGTPHAVAVRLINRLLHFGQDKPGREVLSLLIDKLLTYIGEGDDADFLHQLLERIKSPPPPPGVTPPPPPPQDHLKLIAEAKERAESVKRHLVNLEPEAAKASLQVLSEQKLAPYLPPGDWERLEWLVQVANHNLDNPGQDSLLTDNEALHWIQAEWPNEVAGALVCAMKKTVDTDKLANYMRKLLGEFPLHRVSNTILRDEYCRQWNRIQKIPLQSLTQIDKPRPDEGRTSPLKGKVMGRYLALKDPLLHDYAEWEETKLFGDPKAFWPDHPMYGNIVDTPGNQLLHGQPGSGRTALALALRYNQIVSTQSANRLRVYVSLRPGTDSDWSRIRHHLAETLLVYVCDKATRLFLLEEGQRRLLAHILVQALSPGYVIACLPHMLDDTSEDHQTLDEPGHKFRYQVKRTQHELLIQAISAGANAAPLSDDDWYYSILACCKAIGFSGIHLLLDCSGGTATPELRLISRLHVWQEQGVRSTFLMPTSTFQTARHDMAQNTTYKLTWNNSQLEQLLRHRFQMLAHTPYIEKYFAADALGEFVHSITPPTPRQMVRLWQKIIQSVNPKAEQITMGDIHRARNS